MLVLVFHEFELASLWQRPAWTVAMFDFERTSKSTSQSVIDWFLLLLACLIPVDVGLRRVQLDWSTVGAWFKRKNQEGSVDTLTALLQSKERMANKQKRKTALATAQKTTSPPGGKAEQALTAAREEPVLDEVSLSTFEHLLAMKRRRERDQDS